MKKINYLGFILMVFGVEPIYSGQVLLPYKGKDESFSSQSSSNKKEDLTAKQALGRKQHTLKFSADIPQDEAWRKGERMYVEVVPVHQNAEGTIDGQGGVSRHTILANIEGEERQGVAIRIPRYFLDIARKERFETTMFELIVSMPYMGAEKQTDPFVVKFHISINWDEEDAVADIVRLTVDNSLLFNAPIDAFVINPNEITGDLSSGDDVFDAVQY